MLLRSELSSPPKLTLSSVTISSTDLLLEEHRKVFFSLNLLIMVAAESVL